MRRPKGPAPWGDLWIVRRLGGVRWVWLRHRWFGISLPVPTPLCAYCGCPECNRAIEETEALKMPVPRTEAPDSPPVIIETPKLLAKLPATADLLLQPNWSDGASKQGTCLFVFPSPISVRLLLKVSNPPLKVSALGRNWDEAWAALEAMLKGDDVPWEQDGPRDDKPKKKKK